MDTDFFGDDRFVETNEIKINTVLATKDGRLVGNGIVVEKHPKKDRWMVKTDYGNMAPFSGKEIRELFFIGPVAKPDHKHRVAE